jgi:hypothetical protein
VARRTAARDPGRSGPCTYNAGMRTALLVAWASCVLLTVTPPLPAQEPAERRPFLRLIDNEIDGRLELLIATYTKGSAELVLYAALHIADPAHYLDLQRRFEAHDALLYELIADPTDRPSPGTRTEDDWFNMLQGGMGRGFGLVHQGDHIDYRPANFVHADMSPEEWEEALRRAGSSLIGEAIGMGKNHEPDREAEAAQGSIDLVAAFRSGKGAYELRRLGAQLMVQPDPQRDEPTVIIEGRNEKCLRVLAEQLAAGKQKLGIYYGAGHMEHLERRLLQDLGWKRTGEQWVTAWDNSKRLFPVAEKGLQQKRYRARQDLEALTALLQAWQTKNPGKAPAWDLLRKEATDGKLPGRSDGKDPWGRDYVLRQQGDAHEVRCLGSDGVIDTEDDQAADCVDARGVMIDVAQPRFGGRPGGATPAPTGDRDMPEPAPDMPPLQFDVRIGDSTHRLTEGVESTISLGGQTTKVKLTTAPVRRFANAGVEFDFPREMEVESRRSDDGRMSWTLYGQTCRTYVHPLTATDPHMFASRFVARMAGEDDQLATTGKGSLDLGGNPSPAILADETEDGRPVTRWAATWVKVHPGTVVITVKSSLDADGKVDPESQRVLDLLARTFTRTARK